ncbi:hypothetical protein ELE36_12700 [Pseudolysobacter antarcticus]|uniref:LTXXQ motif family protein n=1 Tax=Pseudolysobacter antarcticus TaxID=2511995 RepID=A0A411HKX2_9GAMM|nr:hypothetical protein [Pseudolysobacter antarcticus]QBB71143.1 hypothetical protein ELE36_12700 [Pseudolysobacter antarcticus]
MNNDKADEMVRTTMTSTQQILIVGFLWFAAICLSTSSVCAQGFGGGKGGGGHGGGNHGNTPQQRTLTPEQAAQPIDTIFGQLQQLKLDLLLKPEQIDAWSAMQYAMRDCDEIEKARARRFTSTSSGAAQLPLVFVQDLADNEHAYAEALAGLAAKMEKLVGLLDARQLKTFNDRLQAVVPRESLRDSP